MVETHARVLICKEKLVNVCYLHPPPKEVDRHKKIHLVLRRQGKRCAIGNLNIL